MRRWQRFKRWWAWCWLPPCPVCENHLPPDYDGDGTCPWCGTYRIAAFSSGAGDA